MSVFTSLPASFPSASSADRALLLDWIRGTSLVYGPWKGFKKLYKDVEAAFVSGERDYELLAALIARLDLAPFEDEKAPDTRPRYAVPTSFTAFKVVGDLLYAVQYNSNLVVFDLSAPLEPKEIYRWTPPSTSNIYYSRLWINGTRLIFGGGNTLRIFDLENPREPRYVGPFEPGSFSSAAIVGDKIYLADYQSLRILNLPASGSSAGAAIGRLDTTYAYNLTAKPGLVAFSHYENRGYRISFVDVSKPEEPRVVSHIDSSNPSAWQFIGDTLLRTDGDFLSFTDLSRSDKPRQLSKIRMQGARVFHVHGDHLFVACQVWNRGTYENKIRIVDISRLNDPVVVGEVEAQSQQMAVYQDLLYYESNGLHILDISELSRPQTVGQRPKNATFGYLKRRSRRLLRTLAQVDGDIFVELASAVLREAGPGHDALDLSSQWVSAELTLGGGSRWHQASHGRGGYVKSPQLVLKRREERSPEAWDNHLSKARELWEAPQLPWQTQEMALKILRSKGETIAPSSPEQLTRFLWSDSPYALIWAARQSQKRLSNGEPLEPLALAPLLWIENPTRRRAVLDAIEAQPQSKTEIATYLATLLGMNAPQGLTRRAREIALLLAARFDLSDPGFSAEGAYAMLPTLLSSAEAPVRAVALGFCRRFSAGRALEALSLLPQVPQTNRESFIEALYESASRGTMDSERIDVMVRHTDLTVREAAWRLLDASQTSNEVLRGVWTKLFAGLKRESIYAGERYRSRYLGERWIESSPLQSAVNSAAALSVLARSELRSDNVLPKFKNSLYSGDEATRISPAVWGAYSLILPAAQVVETILVLPEWVNWQAAWVRANASSPPKLAAFWNAVQEFLASNRPEAQKQILRSRTFEQSGVAATFGGAASQLSPALLMTLIGAVPDNLWQEWRASLLATLQSDAATREAFWSAARSSASLETGFLRARLIEDPEFAATFGLLDTDALEADNPVFTPLLLAWLEAREQALGRAGWLEAAVHPLPAVRDLGLSHLEVLGLDIAGALKLLESKLPPSIDFGRRWFENETERQLELALALSDSPQPSVRAFGRDYIAARLEILMQNGLIGYLQDNPNAEMQAFVAAQLKEKPEAAAPEFDRAVLRGRYRARRAKNLVQERRTNSAPLPDDKTLLELARGRTPRDSEWALTQLARRAMEGNVENVEVNGVGSI